MQNKLCNGINLSFQRNSKIDFNLEGIYWNIWPTKARYTYLENVIIDFGMWTNKFTEIIYWAAFCSYDLD